MNKSMTDEEKLKLIESIINNRELGGFFGLLSELYNVEVIDKKVVDKKEKLSISFDKPKEDKTNPQVIEPKPANIYNDIYAGLAQEENQGQSEETLSEKETGPVLKRTAPNLWSGLEVKNPGNK